MVDFGNRLPGTASHDAFCDWLEEELVEAGLDLLPCDQYEFTRWEAERIGLEILGGPAPRPVDVATAFVRSKETGPAGVEGPLVYGGTLPALSITGTDPEALQAALERYPQDVEGWAAGLRGRVGGSLEGSVLVVDVPAPTPLIVGVFLPLSTYRHWPGHSDAEWAQADYKRPWLGPWPPLAAFAAQGARAVVLIADGSYQLFEGNFSPHTGGFQPIPGLVVDRDTGRTLRNQAGSRPKARLTLVAPAVKTHVRSVTAVLPGRSDETIIVDTHTDGQNAIEENGAVAALQIARHYASLPADRRLERTLVIGLWPSHMTEEIPQADGWMAAHADLVERAAAAVTIEHLGCPEYNDTVHGGYRPTGFPESYGLWTTLGAYNDLAIAALKKADLHRHAILEPVGTTVGVYFHLGGVPHMGGIAGPTYLLVVSENGEMDKVDFELAARQTEFYADVIRRLDGVSAAALRRGDPTLGAGRVLSSDPGKQVECGPRARAGVGNPRRTRRRDQPSATRRRQARGGGEQAPAGRGGGESMPFTGFRALALAALGLGVGGAGAALRRAVTRRG
jgi:hypothetical protein